MNATELIVELVLAGILMLVALLLPGVAAHSVVFPATLDGSVLVAVAIAAGFVLGVIVDRASDTLLDRWLGYRRLRFAYRPRLARQRAELLGADRGATDCFPEDWMRDQALQSQSEAVVNTLSQLRIRIRVARNLVALVPALTTSAAVALCIRLDALNGDTETWLVPLYHLAGLLVLVLAADTTRLEPPRTEDHSAASPSAAQFRQWLWVSPAMCWFAIQLLATATVLFRVSPHALPLIWSALGIGITLTGLAAWAWWRITGTFLGTIWNYSRFNLREKLIAALTGPAGGPTA